MQKEFLSLAINDPLLLKTVEVKEKGWLNRILYRFGAKKPTVVRLELTNASLKTGWRLSLIVKQMREANKEQGSDDTFDLINASTYHLASLIATAVHNKPEPVPDRLTEIVADHFTSEELFATAQEVYRRLDPSSFFGTMGLFQNMTIVNDIPETTASQPISDESS
jgi:hypothetical protein